MAKTAAAKRSAFMGRTPTHTRANIREGPAVAHRPRQEIADADRFIAAGRQLDGLRYKEVVRLVDPTGETARKQYQARAPNRGRAASYQGPAFTAPPIFQQRPPAKDLGQRGVTDTPRN